MVSVLIFQDKYVAEQSENSEGGPLLMNAFEMITLSQGLNLSPLFDRRQVHNSESISYERYLSYMCFFIVLQFE